MWGWWLGILSMEVSPCDLGSSLVGALVASKTLLTSPFRAVSWNQALTCPIHPWPGMQRQFLGAVHGMISASSHLKGLRGRAKQGRDQRCAGQANGVEHQTQETPGKPPATERTLIFKTDRWAPAVFKSMSARSHRIMPPTCQMHRRLCFI